MKDELSLSLMDSSIGIPYGDFDGKIHSSSDYNENHDVRGCKLNKTGPSGHSQAWCCGAGEVDKNPWIQVDFDTDLLIDAVSIQGRGDSNQYVTKFRILYSLDKINFIHFDEFAGNSDNTTVVKRYFKKPIFVKGLRLQVLEFYGDPALRFDLHHIPLTKYDELFGLNP